MAQTNHLPQNAVISIWVINMSFMRIVAREGGGGLGAGVWVRTIGRQGHAEELNSQIT